MKLTKLKLEQLIKEELTKIVEQPQFRTGVPEEDVLAHGGDLEKYPTTDAERESDRIAQELEDIWIDAGNRRKDLGYVDNQIIDLAIEVRNGDIDFEEAKAEVLRLRA